MTRKQVDAWLAASDHSLLPAIRALRREILAADRRMGECVKWKSPTFTYQGNFASINPRTKAHVGLMLHRGAELANASPRIEGDGKTVRMMRFADAAEVKAARAEIRAVVKAWCALRDREVGG